MSEPEITNPKKTEKPKNPKRVEQGKRLAAISRQAKERKKQQREKFFEQKGSAETEVDKIFFGMGVIVAAFLVYKIFLDPKTREGEEDEVPEPPEEMRKVTENSQPEPPKEPKPVETPRKTRSYEPYTMD